MTLIQLRHFIALAGRGSFSRAADELHLTQPALSRSIRALEDELGQPLFDRVGRRNELTAFGRAVLARARQIVFDADELRGSGPCMREGRAGRLRLGLGSGPGAMLMTPLLLRVAGQPPGLQVDVARGGTELLVQALRARQLDALVIDARSLVPATDLHSELVGEMRGAFMCRRGHPLARSHRPLTFERVAAHGIAATPLSDEVARVLVERYGPQAHPQQCVTLRCDEVASLAEAARRSDVVLLAIRAAAPDLVALTLDPPLDATARFALVTLAGRAEAPALGLVRQLAAGLLKDAD